MRAAKPGHTPLSRGLVLLALATGALGMALGNAALLALAASVAAVLHGARAGWPGQGSVGLEPGAARVPRGSGVEVVLPYETSPGPCAYWLHAALPAELVLQDGSNVTVLAPGSRGAERFTAGCPKRGGFSLGPATLTAVHPLLLAPAVQVASAEPRELVVEPRVRPLRRVKELRRRGGVRLGEDLGPAGAGASDFREVRAYQRGDPWRAMNWKATAKRSTHGLELMVNAFEPDARRNVWFFLDLSPRMEVGTTLDNALEDAIEAAVALVHHYATRGHRVGGTTFNAPPLVFYPEAGTRQVLTVARALARVEPGEHGEGLPAAVERVRGFLARERPQVYVLTRPELDPDGLLAGARRIQGYAARARPRPVVVLAPQGGVGSSAEALGRALLAREARARLADSPALRVLPLAEGVASLEAALAKGVLAR